MFLNKLKRQIHPFLFLILTGLASRLIPHPPNFTALNAIALSGTWSFKSPWSPLFVMLLVMLPADYLLGFHSCMPFVYFSYGLSIILGCCFKNRKLLVIILSSLLFFVVVNFGVFWTSPLYPKTLDGAALCYLAAIPFLINQLCGDLFFGALILYGIPFFQKKQIEKGFGPLKSILRHSFRISKQP